MKANLLYVSRAVANAQRGAEEQIDYDSASHPPLLVNSKPHIDTNCTLIHCSTLVSAYLSERLDSGPGVHEEAR